MIDRRKLGILLWPLSLLFRIMVTLRNVLYNAGILKSEKFDVATISVGNITVGGTGKTPHIEYLVQLLNKNIRLAVLSRGYKRKTRGYIIADTTSSAAEIGDEPKQIKSKFPDVTVVVDANRREAIKKIVTEGDQTSTPFHAILLDDAFQHRRVIPGLSILLIDYNRPIDEDRMLPVGNLREPEFSKHRANFIIVSKCPANLKPIECRLLTHRFKVYPHQKLFFTTFKYGLPVNVMDSKDVMTLKALKTSAVLLVSGIAEPEPLKDHLKKRAKSLNSLAYGDHHYYETKDIEKIRKEFEAIASENKIIITTEKDATRMREISLFQTYFENKIYYIPIEVEFLYDGKEQFDEKIMNYVKRNKRNIRLLKK